MVSTQADRGWPTAFQPEFEAALPNYLLDQGLSAGYSEQLGFRLGHRKSGQPVLTLWINS